ncbi:MAG: C25 family cysteine peptidase, partial [candidate division WOR-3 bacterium]|nr:C25 family cysteine peptidase [candidate division WOR-3 bacterium]
ALQPLAEWKTKKGLKTIIAPLSVTGSNASQIKNYIVNANNNWDIRPEYVLLAGHGSLIPTSGSSDDYYADVTGNYRIELSVGRFPVTSVAQLQNIVNKTITYERTPFVSDTLWFRKGMTIVREDYSGYPPTVYPDTYYWANARYCHNLWRNRRYILIDSLSKNLGHSSTNVMNGINDGRAYILFRGQSTTNWWSPFSLTPSQCNNGYKLPVVVSGTCATMNLTNTDYLGDLFLNAGSAAQPKGAIGYFGTTVTASGSGLAVQRGTVAVGFFKALFEEKIQYMGDAAKRAKFILDSIQPPGFSQTRYQEWELFGDPSLQLWTATPERLTVIHDSVLPHTQNHLTITVRGPNGSSVPNALVCLKMDTLIYTWGYTNTQGQITLTFQTQSTGVMDITVTAPNYLPYEGTIRLIPANIPNLYYLSSIINDSGGNNNGRVNPGELINLNIVIRNDGTQSAQEVYGVLRTSSNNIIINDSIAYFGTVGVGQNVTSLDNYQFSVTTNTRNGQTLPFTLYLYDNQNHTWNQQFYLIAYAAQVTYTSLTVIDPYPGGNNNGSIGPNEAGRLILNFSNAGENINNVYGLLRTETPYIIINDSLSYLGNLPTNGSASNSSDPFSISASPTLPRNYQLRLKLLITADGGSYIYNDTLTLVFNSESGTTSDPTGPDNYGYWCYDNTDTLSGRAPVYNWHEIGPGGPGTLIEEITNNDAAVTTFALPFTFRYYGQNYDSISVCSNGFLAMGRTSYRFGNNPTSIPDTSGPAAMIAPLWCDLDPSLAGDIYKYYDIQNHRFIVEFYNVALYNQSTNRQTFQIILYDPIYYPTPTGDGQIQFNYHTINPPSQVTVGIENQSQTIGIQYLRNNTYSPTAAILTAQRAIKFTTLPPLNLQAPWLCLARTYINDSIGGNNNGIPNINETIYLIVKLFNNSPNQASNVSVKLRTADGSVFLIDSITNLGNIFPNDTVINIADPFVFQVTSIPQDSLLDFILEITALNYTNIQYFNIPIRYYPGVDEVEADVFPALPMDLILRPNPAQNIVTIKYILPVAASVELKIYNLLGQVVNTLVNENQDAGSYQITWNGIDESGNCVPRGIYFCTFSYCNKKMIKKLVLY